MTFKAAVVQTASIPFNKQATVEKVVAKIREAAELGAKLIVFPEATISGYPKGSDFGARVGGRLPRGREEFLRYFNGAITVPGPEVDEIGAAAREAQAYVVVGVMEQEIGTLYCTALHFSPNGDMIGKHRKLMPTAVERLIWGYGDGSTMPVFDTPLGKMGTVICWENYMPLLRMTMYGKGIQLYCAPTADDRDTWLPSMQHIALEGRCYVLTACQHITRGAYRDDHESALGDDPATVMMRGGSAIVDPLGRVLAGPDFSGETILYAEIDPGQIARGKYDFDATGHYARPDVFQLTVDERPKRAVSSTAG